MIFLKISFFAFLQDYFGEIITISINEPIRIIELFELFYTKSEEKGSNYFFKEKKSLSDYIILLNGKNINLFEGLKTIIQEDSEISVFPLIGGGKSL